MAEAWRAFLECGWASWLCLFIAMMALLVSAVGVVLLATTARRASVYLGVVAALLGVTAMGVGVLGRQLGIARMDQVLASASIDPAQKARIRAVGTAEAEQCVRVGGVLGSLPFVLGALAAGVGLATRRRAAG